MNSGFLYEAVFNFVLEKKQSKTYDLNGPGRKYCLEPNTLQWLFLETKIELSKFDLTITSKRANKEIEIARKNFAGQNCIVFIFNTSDEDDLDCSLTMGNAIVEKYYCCVGMAGKEHTKNELVTTTTSDATINAIRSEILNMSTNDISIPPPELT